ncbi:MAG: cobalamin biosynthesis protein CobD [Tissierellia bacterium]|nr:cobalamin biosynthesis protein CobD [Tissierellia bacterium]
MVTNIILAVILDFILGDPYSFPHPVKLMGRIISLEDKVARRIAKTNKGLKFAGFIIVVINISLGFLIPFLLLKAIKPYNILYNIVNVYLIYTCIAARSLHYEAMKVYKALNLGIEEARIRLSYIVGRDTKNLYEEGIVRATVETVAENTSDGVIAPLFYITLLGAPGGLAYKFINTMDSMLGYMNEKYKDLGYFPAKLDDIFNFLPARITGLLMSLGSIGRFNLVNGIKIMFRDRKNHKSPNAPYPEGAVAGLLGIQLGGSNYYHGKLVEKPTIGDKINPINKKHIKNSIEIMYRSQVLLVVIYTLIKLIK